jgi:hypothetical protein
MKIFSVAFMLFSLLCFGKTCAFDIEEIEIASEKKVETKFQEIPFSALGIIASYLDFEEAWKRLSRLSQYSRTAFADKDFQMNFLEDKKFEPKRDIATRMHLLKLKIIKNINVNKIKTLKIERKFLQTESFFMNYPSSESAYNICGYEFFSPF